MKIEKMKEIGICQECGKRGDDNRPIYELDFGTTNIYALQMCRECMNRLWCNLDLLIDED